MKADTAQISQTNDLLTQVESKIPENYRYPEAILEGRNWQNSSEFAQLQNIVKTVWPTLLHNLPTVAPSETDKTILFVAMQSMPADNYLQFLDGAVGLAETKGIDKRLLKWALFPADKNVRGLLDYNYDKPIVRDILQRVKVLYADDQNMVKYCDVALSGEAKKNAEAYFKDNPDEPRPGPALNKGATILPNPIATKPIESTPGPTLTSVASPTPTAPIAQTPAIPFEHSASVWPWLVGIVALVVIITLALQRRS